jgi:hypothetical protein
MAPPNMGSIVLRIAMKLFARSIEPGECFAAFMFVARLATLKAHVSRLNCLLAMLLPLSSCVMPVQTGETILRGRYVQEAELQKIEHEGATRLQVERRLGPPTAWFERQRILVYGLVRSDSAAVWLIPGFPTSTGGYLEFVEREAIFLAINADDSVVGAGRRSVPRGMTWLEAALKWSREAGLAVSAPHSEFFAESIQPDESLIVIYRPRDNQYVLPFFPPGERLLSNFDFFAEVYLDSILITQLRSKSYFSIRVPPGSHILFVSPYADQNPMLEYRSATVEIEARPATTQFIDVRMEAGKGYIGPVIQQMPESTATPVLARLPETW